MGATRTHPTDDDGDNGRTPRQKSSSLRAHQSSCCVPRWLARARARGPGGRRELPGAAAAGGRRGAAGRHGGGWSDRPGMVGAGPGAAAVVVGAGQAAGACSCSWAWWPSRNRPGPRGRGGGRRRPGRRGAARRRGRGDAARRGNRRQPSRWLLLVLTLTLAGLAVVEVRPAPARWPALAQRAVVVGTGPAAGSCSCVWRWSRHRPPASARPAGSRSCSCAWRPSRSCATEECHACPNCASLPTHSA